MSKASPVAPPSVTMAEVKAASPPLPVSTLPEGVQMHDAARPPAPVTYDDAAIDTRVRKDPPPGWQGSYTRCGGCGDFMTAESCPRCTAVHS